MSTHEKLLPWPFCGGEARMHPNNWLSCTLCNIFTDIHDTQSEALAHWNRRATPPAAVPDGWVLVPKEPTQEMTDCVAGYFDFQTNSAANAYRAMISAAPAAPTEASDE